MTLSNQTLAHLPDHITRPRYDRAALKAGIIHFGIGNFHRAHQAVYTDDVLNAGDIRWGITGVSLRRADMRDALSRQDYLYTLGVKSAEQTAWRVIGAVKEILYAPDAPSAVIEAIASPETRIISLTVTEKAYCLSQANGALDERHPDIVHDLADPEHPISVIGYLVAGLRLRRDRKLRLPTILSCDNLTANGQKLRRALIRFAELNDRDLESYFADQLACPNTMVDRIVPHTTDDDRQAASDALGAHDAWPVMTEPFSQSVIEDHFPLGRPDWDQFGAQFVKDVALYERMKLGLLNTSHSALAFLGSVAGYETVYDAMSQDGIKIFIEHVMREDIAPFLDLPADMQTKDYQHALITRFLNPALHHRLLQIASDSSQKIPQRFMPTITRRLKQGHGLGRFAYAVAGFMLLLEGQSETGQDLNFTDARAMELKSAIARATGNVAQKFATLLSDQQIFGDLATNASTCDEIIRAYDQIKSLGVIAALRCAN